MPLKLMYITKKCEIASIAENAGVDRVFIDMEYVGKEARQAGMDTVKSHHTVEDVANIRKVVNRSELLVRVNPIHSKTADDAGSVDEINRVIDAGADVIMLPMYKTVAEVEEFVRIVNGRAKTMLLNETVEACDILDDVLKINEVDELHIGLNDLHLAKRKKFMFELLVDGTVDNICAKLSKSGKKYGFGGIARIGYGLLPSEYVIAEHYRLGSSAAILSRTFCNADKVDDIDTVGRIFMSEVAKIREAEERISMFTVDEFESNRKKVKELVAGIVASM